MKKENIYLLIIVIIEIIALLVIIWLFTHSEYVTHAEFMAGMTAIFVATSAGFWALWMRISELAEKIGYVKGKSNK